MCFRKDVIKIIDCILDMFVLNLPMFKSISCQSLQIRNVVKDAFYHLSLSWRSARVKKHARNILCATTCRCKGKYTVLLPLLGAD